MKKKTMRSQRRIDFDHHLLSSIHWDESKPAPTSISWRLWDECRDVAEAAMETAYVKGIAQGNLSPDAYGHYSVQDCAYCNNAKNDYKTVENRARSEGFPRLAAFAESRYDSYEAYCKNILETWHIKDPNAISPTPAAQTYIHFEHEVAERYSPACGMLAMLPCDHLWAWLGTELAPKIETSNIYGAWVSENADWTGAYRLDNFIDEWFSRHIEHYDWNEASFIYRTCMICELNFFKSACGEPLTAMPEPPASPE